MVKFYNGIKEIYNELVHKVSWPSREELYRNTITVMIASIIMSVVMFAIDFSFKNIVTFFYKNIF